MAQSFGFRSAFLICRMSDAIIATPLYRNEQNGRMSDAGRMGDFEAEWAILRPNG